MKSKQFSKIIRNALFLLCMNLSSVFALFVFSVLLTRTLGKATLGMYTLFTAALMPFAYFVDFGQSTSLIQEIGRAPHRSSQVLKDSLALKTILVVAATVLLFGFSVLFFDQLEERRLFLLFGLILLPRAFSSTFEAMLRAHQKMAKLLYSNVPTSLLLIAGSWLLLWNGAGFDLLLVFLIILEFVKAALTWIIADRALDLKLLKSRNSIQLSYCLTLLRRSLPFFVIGIVGILHYRVDVILLAYLRDHLEVGIFSGAVNFVSVLRFAPSVIVAAFFPAISSLKSDSPMFRALTRKTLAIQFVASVGLALAVFALAPFLIDFTYRIPESVTVLKLLVWAMIPMSIYSTLIYVFYQFDKSKWSLKVLSGAVVLNVILNLILIPNLGALSLAISTLVSETFACLVCLSLFVSLSRRVAVDIPKPQCTVDHDVAAISYEGTR